MNHFKERCHQCKIPDVDTSAIKLYELNNWDVIQKFIKGEGNLAIVSSNHFTIMAKIAKTVIAYNMEKMLRFYSMSFLTQELVSKVDYSDIDVICIPEIYGNFHYMKKESMSAILSNMLMKNKQLILGSDSTADIKEVFGTIWHTIDNTFEVVKD